MSNVYVAKFVNAKLAITYDHQEKSIKVAIKGEPLFKLLPSGHIAEPGSRFIDPTWDVKRALKIFYDAIITDITNLHTAMAVAAEKASGEGDYIAVLIDTKDERIKK